MAKLFYFVFFICSPFLCIHSQVEFYTDNFGMPYGVKSCAYKIEGNMDIYSDNQWKESIENITIPFILNAEEGNAKIHIPTVKLLMIDDIKYTANHDSAYNDFGTDIFSGKDAFGGKSQFSFEITTTPLSVNDITSDDHFLLLLDYNDRLNTEFDCVDARACILIKEDSVPKFRFRVCNVVYYDFSKKLFWGEFIETIRLIGKEFY